MHAMQFYLARTTASCSSVHLSLLALQYVRVQLYNLGNARAGHLVCMEQVSVQSGLKLSWRGPGSVFSGKIEPFAYADCGGIRTLCLMYVSVLMQLVHALQESSSMALVTLAWFLGPLCAQNTAFHCGFQCSRMDCVASTLFIAVSVALSWFLHGLGLILALGRPSRQRGKTHVFFMGSIPFPQFSPLPLSLSFLQSLGVPNCQAIIARGRRPPAGRKWRTVRAGGRFQAKRDFMCAFQVKCAVSSLSLYLTDSYI